MRLELSSEGRYALRALVYLAEIGEQASAARLSHEGLVVSEQGRRGGSRLARPPQEITLLDAVEAAEGPFGVTRCIMQNRACGSGPPCAMHNAWEEGQQAILGYLETQTLDDFVQKTASRRLTPGP
jgi:DNA-binding IscR family transcriptional regulator